MDRDTKIFITTEKEVIKMAEISKDMKRILFPRSAKAPALVWKVSCYVALACLIVGIVGDAANKKLGLEPTNWFIIMVGFLILAVGSYLTAYHAAKEGM
jgi:hypothetical protein